MKKIVSCCIFGTILLAQSPFESKAAKHFDLSAYETKLSKENIKAANNPKIKCRWVCDKKLYTEQKISQAISFYKHSKEYHFSH